MIYGRYKKTWIFIWKDEETNKWFAKNNGHTLHDKMYSDLYDTLDQLRDALRLNTTNWYDYKEHYYQLKKVS